ncbi:MAG: nucleotidyltransferase domain-containing protein [Clostridium sp.]|nr:nucleotidyltransferase domain-containing protein [Clostridium sp.]
MTKTVVELQKAFQSIVNTLKKNKKVLAIFTFGSIVSGDVWEESDIDLFVVYKDEYSRVRDVYSESLGVQVHTKLLNKESFLKLYKKEKDKGFVRNLLISSKLIYSNDKDISNLYNKARYSLKNTESEKWNLVYLGMLLKDLGICRKYLQNGGNVTSYEILIRVFDNYSKLLMNLSGYTVTKDSLTMAVNLNDDFRKIVNDVFNSEVSKEKITASIKYISDFLDGNIMIISRALLNFLEEKDEFVSSYEISTHESFDGFKIKIENILKELAKREIIVKHKRSFKDESGAKILDENVYAAKIRK